MGWCLLHMQEDLSSVPQIPWKSGKALGSGCRSSHRGNEEKGRPEQAEQAGLDTSVSSGSPCVDE